jgi:hypothetical protein
MDDKLRDRNPRPKAQHFVPRFYLANFVDEDGMVWTYDPVSDSVRASTPEKTAVQTNFYSAMDADGNYIDAIETWLSGVGSKAADLYPKVLRGEVLKGQARADFAVFVSSLFARSPAQVNFAAEMIGAFAQMTNDMMVADRVRFEQLMDQWEADTGRKTTPEQREDTFNFARDKSRYTITVDRMAGLRGMAVADTLTDIFFKMKWIVVECVGQHVITSDSPVVRITPREYHSPVYGDGGLVHKHAFVTLPLTFTKVMELSWSETGDKPHVFRAGKDRGRLYNRQRAAFTLR